LASKVIYAGQDLSSDVMVVVLLMLMLMLMFLIPRAGRCPGLMTSMPGHHHECYAAPIMVISMSVCCYDEPYCTNCSIYHPLRWVHQLISNTAIQPLMHIIPLTLSS
jgi:hypothetical protein